MKYDKMIRILTIIQNHFDPDDDANKNDIGAEQRFDALEKALELLTLRDPEKDKPEYGKKVLLVIKFLGRTQCVSGWLTKTENGDEAWMQYVCVPVKNVVGWLPFSGMGRVSDD